MPKFGPYKKFFDEVLPVCRDPYEILDKYSDEYANNPEFIHNCRFHENAAISVPPVIRNGWLNSMNGYVQRC